MMRSQFLRHSLKTYATQMAYTLLQALIAIAAARLLGPANKGVLSLLTVMLVMAVTLGRCGLGSAVIYFAGRRPAWAVIFNGGLLIAAIGAATAVLSLPVILLSRPQLLRGIPLTGLLWVAAMIPVLFAFDYFQSAFIAILQVNRRNLLLLLHPLVQLVLLAVTVGALRQGLAGALFSLSAALVIGVAWSLVKLKREMAGRLLRADRGLMKQLLRFGMRSHLGGVMEVMNSRADFLLINFFLGPAAVGFFSVAVNLGEIIWRFPEAVVLMLMPRVARMDADQAGAFTPRICRLVLLPVLLFCLGMLLLGRILIHLFFGASFLPAVAPLLWLLPGFAAFAVWKILAGDLVARGRPLIYSATAAAAFAAMVLLDLWLIPIWGITGAAAASSAAYLFASVLIILMYRRVTGVRLGDLLLAKKADFRLLRESLRRNSLPSQ